MKLQRFFRDVFFCREGPNIMLDIIFDMYAYEGSEISSVRTKNVYQLNGKKLKRF